MITPTKTTGFLGARCTLICAVGFIFAAPVLADTAPVPPERPAFPICGVFLIMRGLARFCA